MKRQVSIYRKAVIGSLLFYFAYIGASFSASPQSLESGVKAEWFGWSVFRITSVKGKVILTNPWLGNPDSQLKLEEIDRVDVILVATGHRDEIGETVEIANKTGAKVVTTWGNS